MCGRRLCCDPVVGPHQVRAAAVRRPSRRYDLLAEALSFGQNRRWRRTMVDSVVEGDPATVLDVATGTAGVALQLAAGRGHRSPGSTSPRRCCRGRASVLDHGLDQRIALVGGQAERLPFPDATFDALTFTYLLRYVADPAATIAELVRVVRPGGTIASLEFYVPPRRLWRGAPGGLHPRGPACPGRLAGREWYRAGRFLGPSISAHYDRYPLPTTVDAWLRAGSPMSASVS